MKKHVAVILIVLSLGVFSWAQASKDLFDVKKSQTELEIMKGILSTTISYVSQNYRKDSYRINFSNVGAYYLVGQGAVFVIPTSGLRSPYLIGPSIDLVNTEISKEMDYLRENAQSIAAEAQREAYAAAIFANRGVGSGVGSGVGKGTASAASGAAEAVTPPAPPAPPTPPTPQAPPAPPQVDREQLQKKVEEYQAKIKKNREEAEANREKFLESLKEIRVYLVEALANYGDSLTTVKPNEYINLVLYTDSFDPDLGRMKVRSDIISAQKSWISDYKAGRLSLDNFKQKVLQYTQ